MGLDPASEDTGKGAARQAAELDRRHAEGWTGSEDTRERIARAICENDDGPCWEDLRRDSPLRERYLRNAGAVLADAAREIEEGYKPSSPAEDTPRERTAHRLFENTYGRLRVEGMDSADARHAALDAVLAVVGSSPADPEAVSKLRGLLSELWGFGENRSEFRSQIVAEIEGMFVASPGSSPVGEEGACEFCGERIEGDVFERWGLPFCGEKHAGKCNPDEMDNPNDEGHWLPAAPPVGVDEGQRVVEIVPAYALREGDEAQAAYAVFARIRKVEKYAGTPDRQVFFDGIGRGFKLLDNEPTLRVLAASSAAPGVTGLREFADRVENDRHEPDKLLCHVQSMRRAALAVSPVGVEGFPCGRPVAAWVNLRADGQIRTITVARCNGSHLGLADYHWLRSRLGMTPDPDPRDGGIRDAVSPAPTEGPGFDGQREHETGADEVAAVHAIDRADFGLGDGS